MDINNIYNGDCFDLIKLINDKTIDLIITDPPYNTTNLEFDKDPIDLELMFNEYSRIIKDNGIVIIFGLQPFTTDLIIASRNTDLKFRYELIYEKTLALGFLDCNKKPLRAHENIEVFYKNKSTYNPQFRYDGTKKSATPINAKMTEIYGKHHYHTYKSDGKRYPRSVLKYYNKYNLTNHPTEKPLLLIEYLIKTYSNEEDLILDTFIGSGTIAHACINLNRNYIGMEINKEYYDIAIKRIEKANKEKNFVINSPLNIFKK